MPNAKKLPSPQERLELILLGLARRETATALCRQAGVSRELFYRWMRAVREAGLKALAAKAPGPKLIEPEKAPKEALRLRERVARLEKENKALRQEGAHWKLLAETAKRIIHRRGWGPEPKVKKNAMRSPKPESPMPRSGAENAPPEPGPKTLPGAGGSAEARTGDGSAGAGVQPGEPS
ncbi:MAG: transposase [Elusimicrobiota bacterium]